MKFTGKHKLAVLMAALICGMQCTVMQTVSAATLLQCGFEDGTDSFTSRYGGTVAVSTSYASEGQQSLFVSGRTSSWQGASIDVNSFLKAGNTYSVACQVYQKSGSPVQVKMTLQYSDSSGTQSYDQIALESVPSDSWNTLSNASYKVPDGATQLIMYLETPESTTDFYVDDVIINGAPADIKKGDADGNSIVNTADVLALKKWLHCSSNTVEAGADLNGDNSINITDTLILKNQLITPVVNPWDTYQETADSKRIQFYKDSIYQMGNTTRLREKIQKAQNGEKVTVAYLGGSITEGGGLDTCYAHRSYEYFANTFGTGSNVSYINAGMSGTSSVVGLLRAQNDILKQKSDVIFIEFSVNDHPEDIYKKSFESLVKKCLSQDNNPAVIIIINRAKGGYSMQAQMAPVGKNYNVPVISMDNALTNAFNSGYLTTADYFNDEYHPHSAGCALISECISYYYRQALKTENATSPYTIPSTSVYGSEYATADIAPISSLSNLSNGSFVSGTTNNRFPYGWTFSKNSANTPMTFSTTGKGIFILFKSNQNSSLGVLDVTVNGTTKKIAGNRNYAWGGADADIAYIQNTSGTLNVSMKMDSASTDFVIWGIGVIK